MYNTVADFINEWNNESIHMQNVLNTLTDASLEQSISHESRTLGRLAWHIVGNIPEYLVNFGVQIERVNNIQTVPSTAKEIADTFEKVSSDVVQALKTQWTDADLAHVQDFFGRPSSNASIFLGLIKHMIHHRGQMTVLMRKADLPLPFIYGPTREGWIKMGQEAPKV